MMNLEQFTHAADSCTVSATGVRGKAMMPRQCADEPRWGALVNRHRRIVLAATAAAAVLLSAGAAAADGKSCLKPEERVSLEIRALQTELMVGALACDAQSDYNAFVMRFRPELARHGKTMTEFFARAYGRASEREATRYVTRLANLSSLASQSNPSRFCDQAKAKLRASQSVPPREFDSFTVAHRSPAAVAEFQPCSIAQR